MNPRTHHRQDSGFVKRHEDSVAADGSSGKSSPAKNLPSAKQIIMAGEPFAHAVVSVHADLFGTGIAVKPETCRPGRPQIASTGSPV